MKYAIIAALAAFTIASAQQQVTVGGGAPRIYIPAQGGFETYLSAAIVKKHVPVVVTEAAEQARFTLTGVIQQKEESTGGKIARCLFAYCAGIDGQQIETVKLIDARTKEIVWAYTVQKVGSHRYQSTAESVAKHLKQFLEKHQE